MGMSPFRGRGFYDLHSEMNRMFDEVFGSGSGRRGGRQVENPSSQWTPALDVIDEEGDLVVRAELPGVRPENVNVTVSRGMLTLSGEREAEEERRAAGYYVRERRHGSFRRSMQLPEGVSEDDITARFQDGILEVRIPGAAGIQEPRRIQIESPSAGSATDVETRSLGSEGPTPGTEGGAEPPTIGEPDGAPGPGTGGETPEGPIGPTR